MGRRMLLLQSPSSFGLLHVTHLVGGDAGCSTFSFIELRQVNRRRERDGGKIRQLKPDRCFDCWNSD